MSLLWMPERETERYEAGGRESEAARLARVCRHCDCARCCWCRLTVVCREALASKDVAAIAYRPTQTND